MRADSGTERHLPCTGLAVGGYCASMDRDPLVAEAFLVLRRRKAVIVLCALAGVLAGCLYILLRPRVYEATTKIEITPANTAALGLDELSARALTGADSTTQLQTVVQVLESNTLALDVMDQLELAQNRAFATGWQQAPGTKSSEWSPQVRDRLLKRFHKALVVDLVPKTDVLVVTFRAKSPDIAAQVSNTVVRKFRERNLRTSYESANEVSDWLSAQLDTLRDRARKSQQELAVLEKTTGLLGQDETDNIVLEKLKQLDEALTGLESDRIVKEARYRIAASGNPELLATSSPDATLQLLRTQQAGLRLQYAQLSSKFGPAYPKLAEVAEQISSVDSAVDRQLEQLKQQYRNEYEAAAGSERLLRTRFEAQKQRAYELNEGASQHAILKREVESTQQLYETLQLKLKQAGIAAGLASANVAMVDPAQIPSEPVEPKPLSALLIGLSAGIVGGIGLAVTLEAADDAVRSLEEAEESSSLPLLATVPRVRPPHSRLLSRKRQRLLDGVQPVTLRRPRSRAAESYRVLCNGLGRPGQMASKIITITSATAFEGKTTTATNLAVVLAQSGAKVLLVDGDLRQPSVHTCFEVPQSPGLADQLGAVINCQASQSQHQPGLWILPSGATTNFNMPKVKVQSVKTLLEQWREQYDHVVIDAPPVSLVSDATLFAACSDAVVLIVRCGTTARRELRRTCSALHRAHANLSGFVLNAIDAAPFYRNHAGSAIRRAGKYEYYAED